MHEARLHPAPRVHSGRQTQVRRIGNGSSVAVYYGRAHLAAAAAEPHPSTMTFLLHCFRAVISAPPSAPEKPVSGALGSSRLACISIIYETPEFAVVAAAFCNVARVRLNVSLCHCPWRSARVNLYMHAVTNAFVLGYRQLKVTTAVRLVTIVLLLLIQEVCLPDWPTGSLSVSTAN